MTFVCNFDSRATSVAKTAASSSDLALVQIWPALQHVLNLSRKEGRTSASMTARLTTAIFEVG